MNKEIIMRLEEVSSTQTHAKALREQGKPVVVIAKRQTGGQGTKNRSFSSKEGGLYFSKLSFYENFSAKDAFKLTQRTAVAVCKTLEDYGFAPKIKWANDVFVNEKKICGILIENTFSGAKLLSSVIGVGLNVNNALPSELSQIATTMQAERGVAFDLQEVEKRLLVYLNEEFFEEDYRVRLGWIGEQVALEFSNERVHATLLSVNGRGELVVKIGGEIKEIAAGEISLRVNER